ncbi:MAG: pyridoxal 5'-phosphate synthase glutaminase subunit PdxT [Candidatus Eremiobacteraeota bacterium]|nr:pyridoxal 5'-phosphate synthase glutaminase subunit PdxT [Candidatus Eremiobacteraeota bacterium]
MTTIRHPRVGVLALQGDVSEHLVALEEVGAEATTVKTRAELEAVDGLVIPGGESTTVIKLLERFDLAPLIKERVADGMPLWGTCMGLIVVARAVAELPEQPTLALLDVSVRRNAFGRQIASGEVELEIAEFGARPFPAIFIRAPWIEESGPQVRILAQLDGHGVLVQQGRILGSSFHPELSPDRRLHEYFIDIVRDAAAIGKLARPA